MDIPETEKLHVNAAPTSPTLLPPCCYFSLFLALPLSRSFGATFDENPPSPPALSLFFPPLPSVKVGERKRGEKPLTSL
jgi:hypothetical protein